MKRTHAANLIRTSIFKLLWVFISHEDPETQFEVCKRHTVLITFVSWNNRIFQAKNNLSSSFSHGEYKLEKLVPPLSSPQLALESPQWLPRGHPVTAILYLRKPLSSAQNKMKHLAAEGWGLSEQVPQNQAIIWILKTGSLFLRIEPLRQVFFQTRTSCSLVQPAWS